MTVLLIISCIITTISLICLFFVTKRAVELSDRLEETYDQVEESLNVLDSAYKDLVEVCDLPLASDDPYVRRVVEQIKLVKETIHLIAKKISSQFEENSDNVEGSDD